MLLKLLDNLDLKSWKEVNYKGIVVDNNDPKKLGRVKCKIQGIFETDNNENLPWCYPRNPASLGGRVNLSSFAVPEVGSELLIVFDSFKDAYFPEYVGYWQNLSTTHQKSLFDDNYPNVYGTCDSVPTWFRQDKVSHYIEFFRSLNKEFFRFDEEGNLHINIPKSLVINVGENYQINVEKKLTQKTGDNWTAKVGGDCEFQVDRRFGVKAGPLLTLQASMIHENSGIILNVTPGDVAQLTANINKIKQKIQELYSLASSITADGERAKSMLISTASSLTGDIITDTIGSTIRPELGEYVAKQMDKASTELISDISAVNAASQTDFDAALTEASKVDLSKETSVFDSSSGTVNSIQTKTEKLVEKEYENLTPEYQQKISAQLEKYKESASNYNNTNSILSASFTTSLEDLSASGQLDIGTSKLSVLFGQPVTPESAYKYKFKEEEGYVKSLDITSDNYEDANGLLSDIMGYSNGQPLKSSSLNDIFETKNSISSDFSSVSSYLSSIQKPFINGISKNDFTISTEISLTEDGLSQLTASVASPLFDNLSTDNLNSLYGNSVDISSSLDSLMESAQKLEETVLASDFTNTDFSLDSIISSSEEYMSQLLNGINNKISDSIDKLSSFQNTSLLSEQESIRIPQPTITVTPVGQVPELKSLLGKSSSSLSNLSKTLDNITSSLMKQNSNKYIKDTPQLSLELDHVLNSSNLTLDATYSKVTSKYDSLLEKFSSKTSLIDTINSKFDKASAQYSVQSANLFTLFSHSGNQNLIDHIEIADSATQDNIDANSIAMYNARTKSKKSYNNVTSLIEKSKQNTQTKTMFSMEKFKSSTVTLQKSVKEAAKRAIEAS